MSRLIRHFNDAAVDVPRKKFQIYTARVIITAQLFG